jgi:hypothetical protein
VRHLLDLAAGIAGLVVAAAQVRRS